MLCDRKGKGKGGRNPAEDARLNPNIDPKKAARIMANRLSAARSKLRQKATSQGLHQTKISVLVSQKTKISREINELARICAGLEEENLMLGLQAGRKSRSSGGESNAGQRQEGEQQQRNQSDAAYDWMAAASAACEDLNSSFLKGMPPIRTGMPVLRTSSNRFSCAGGSSNALLNVSASMQRNSQPQWKGPSSVGPDTPPPLLVSSQSFPLMTSASPAFADLSQHRVPQHYGHLSHYQPQKCSVAQDYHVLNNNCDQQGSFFTDGGFDTPQQQFGSGGSSWAAPGPEWQQGTVAMGIPVSMPPVSGPHHGRQLHSRLSAPTALWQKGPSPSERQQQQRMTGYPLPIMGHDDCEAY